MAAIQSVLICPQHWGLGHVTRSIPIIRYFISKNYKVVLACSGAGSDLLRLEFPGYPVYELPDYGIRYPFKSMYLNIGYQMIQMHWAIIKEHFVLRKICKQEYIELVVSDARLGAFQFGIPSVIIAHHLHFSLGFKLAEWCSDIWMKFFYDRFDQLWIPDVDGPPNLSGDLSHLYQGKNKHFIGLLSRFKKMELDKMYDFILMLSGPEPQRSYLEAILLNQLTTLKFSKAVLIRGTNKGPLLNRELVDQLPALEIREMVKGDELNQLMCASKIVICRSGYSTLLDLSVIQSKAILIPTPGQPEQEYLSEELMKQKLYYSVKQDSIDLEKDLEASKDFSCELHFHEKQSLESQLDALVDQLTT